MDINTDRVPAMSRPALHSNVPGCGLLL